MWTSHSCETSYFQMKIPFLVRWYLKTQILDISWSNKTKYWTQYKWKKAVNILDYKFTKIIPPPPHLALMSKLWGIFWDLWSKDTVRYWECIELWWTPGADRPFIFCEWAISWCQLLCLWSNRYWYRDSSLIILGNVLPKWMTRCSET